MGYKWLGPYSIKQILGNGLCERFVHKASYSESEWLPFEALPTKIN